MTIGEVVEIKSTFTEKEVHWIIPDFFSLSKKFLHSAPVFTFLDVCWYLQIDPSQTDSGDHIALHLEVKDMKLFCSVMCTVAIKTSEGLFVRLTSLTHNFCAKNDTFIASQFFTRTQLSNYSSELMPSNNLTIVCKLKHVTDKILELDTLSENMKHLYTNKEFCDTVLHVKNEEFKAHRIILAARSPVFASYFKHNMVENRTGIITITDCDSDSFEDFLVYLYCGKLENISPDTALNLYKTADKYDVQGLKMFCMENMKCNLSIENVCHITSLAEEYDDRELLSLTQDFFNKNFKQIFLTEEWKELFKKNFNVANKLLIRMALNVEIINSAKWKVT